LVEATLKSKTEEDTLDILYREALEKVLLKKLKYLNKDSKILEIDIDELHQYSALLKLVDKILNSPEEAIDEIKSTLRELIELRALEEIDVDNLHIAFKGIEKYQLVKIRELRSSHLGKLVAIEGIIKLSSMVKPILKRAVFRHECGYEVEKMIKDVTEKITKPRKCPKCGKSGEWEIVEEEYEDIQRLVLEELPENLTGGSQPERVTVILKGPLVEPKINNKTIPGIRVRITGIPKTAKLTEKGSVYDIIIEANNIEFLEKGIEEVIVTPKDLAEIKEIAAENDPLESLVKSFAPSIYGYEDIKKALLLQMVGGVKKIRKDGTKVRGHIHILLVGDPGTAKSTLLKYVTEIAPRSRYVSGTSATAVGLVAVVVRDDLLKVWSIEAGPMVLANGGILALDEIEKLGKQELMILHEAMEQGSVTISKAGIHVSLKTETAVLAAANPKFGRWDPNLSLVQQIDIPPTILNRFDLIFLIRDTPGKEHDEMLAERVLESYIEDIEPLYPSELIRKYLMYVKKHIQPKLTKGAIERIKEFFVSLRSLSNELGPIPISTRQLESIVRLAEASARIRFSNEVTVDDANLAIQLTKKFLEEAGYDPEAKTYDITMLETGKPKSMLDKQKVIIKIIKTLDSGDGVSEMQIKEEAAKHGIGETTVEKLLRQLEAAGDIFQPKPGKYKIIS